MLLYQISFNIIDALLQDFLVFFQLSSLDFHNIMDALSVYMNRFLAMHDLIYVWAIMFDSKERFQDLKLSIILFPNSDSLGL